MKPIQGKDSLRLTEWLKENAHKYERDELLAAVNKNLKLVITRDALRKRMSALGVSPKSPQVSFEEIRVERRQKRDDLKLRKEYDHLLLEYENLVAERDAVLALDGHPAGAFKIEQQPNQEYEATAVCLASDWHVEETVLPQTVNGKNTYNLNISKERAGTFFNGLLKMIKKERQNVHISTLVLWLGGDFISSNIHDELLENCSLRPIDAMLLAEDYIESGINFLLDNSDLKLVIPCSCGNHSRMTKKVHVSTERGNSLEWMMYHHLAKKYAGNPRVKFIVEDSYLTYLKVYDYTIRFHHGHAIKYAGGVGGLHIPLNKAVAMFNRTEWADIDCIGHFHTYTPAMSYVVNGSLIGYNSFGIWIKAPYEPPTQAFFLINSKRGLSMHTPIWL